MRIKKEDVLKSASIAITAEACYSCYPDDLEEYYKEGMTARQLADVFIEQLRKNEWFDKN